MREIKFRGVSVFTKVWVYGYLVPRDMLEDPDFLEKYWIATGNGNECHPVVSESVGQFTGLKDKNGKEIWEGDICRTTVNGKWWEIIFKDGAWRVSNHGIKEAKRRFAGDEEYFLHQYLTMINAGHYLEVIGNIYEPEKTTL